MTTTALEASAHEASPGRWCPRTSRCQTAYVPSSRGALLRPGCFFSFAPDPRTEGRAERREAHYVVCRACEARPSALVRRGASRDAGRSHLGALMSRVKPRGAASRPPPIPLEVIEAMIVQRWERNLETSVIIL